MWCTWSLMSQRIPTYRRKSSKIDFPKFGRATTHKEKMASLGFPVTPELATATETEEMVTDENTYADCVGICMMIPVVVMAQIALLACCEFDHEISKE